MLHLSSTCRHFGRSDAATHPPALSFAQLARKLCTFVESMRYISTLMLAFTIHVQSLPHIIPKAQHKLGVGVTVSSATHSYRPSLTVVRHYLSATACRMEIIVHIFSLLQISGVQASAFFTLERG